MNIVNVTYRLPVSFVSKHDNVSLKVSSGGLVAALNSLSQGNYKLKWIGVADFTPKQWQVGESLYNGNFILHPVFLPDKMNRLFYEGFSNSVLWPLFHYFPSFVDYTDEQFNAYIQANEIIAEKVAAVVESGDMVWIHDYHLFPLAGLLRKSRPDLNMGFFLHIPFPNYELLRLLPEKCRNYLLDGVLGADVIGFHTFDYATHFLHAVKYLRGVQQKQFILSVADRSVKVDAFPISIDYNALNAAFNDEEVAEQRKLLRQHYSGKKIIFSVDRLDYTKGILNRLYGYKTFLENHPEWREKLVFILVLVPSRITVRRYAERRKMIEELISNINGTLGSFNWTPVVFQFSSLQHKELLGLYTTCNVALISPLRDGMNLVAKEFVASRKDEQGVLMLSNLTGASDELSEALLFNPLDQREIAATIEAALLMPEEEQQRRLRFMRALLQRFDIHSWANSFCKAIMESGGNNSVALLRDEFQRDLLNSYKNAKRRLVILDYDGTLTSIKLRPELADPSVELLVLLSKLGSIQGNLVVVASGRRKDTLEQWLGGLPVSLIAEHGAYLKRSQWQRLIGSVADWKEEVRNIMQLFVYRCAGSFIEEKDFSLAWHYRNVGENIGSAKAVELAKTLEVFLENTSAAVLSGKKVVEVKPQVANKGNALLNSFNFEDYDFILAVGDDKTDEDVFSLLRSFNNAYTLKVGNGATSARYRIGSVTEVLEMLKHMVS